MSSKDFMKTLLNKKLGLRGLDKMGDWKKSLRTYLETNDFGIK